ncbi:multidrug DMT transporter permease [Pedobacter petrophilus]|uniref:Multidrug DMT transporter permease n=1 Tax=Pedobacter petrophilus TaxID=1908241 RepID=A0A7K0G042_9SPHI|nr:multidrug DMT transporter permease [Pedobacter petrophilus]MRX76972.1 multidrug DMT transporter permease [Pedobacter petrophilus]
MYTPESYTISVILCFVAMFAWGSWANTQKLASKTWRFELFYWDYTIGILLFSLVLALTLGSSGSHGRSFADDFAQAGSGSIGSAMLGGLIFNIANILLVAAIAIAGMSIAITICVGIALVLGVFINYMASPVGDPVYLAVGVFLVALAIITSAFAYRKMNNGSHQTSAKGIVLAVISGVLMSFFYRFVAKSMAVNLITPEAGLLSPYTAIFFFSLGIFVSNFILNTVIMKKPFVGQPVSYSQYFEGTLKTHLIGVLGGSIWCIGMSASILAAGKAGFAISYGLGQGATVVAILWGIFVWKEFKNPPKGTLTLLSLTIAFYVFGLIAIIVSKIV